MTLRHCAAAAATLLLLAACGGGSDTAPDSQNLPDAGALEGAPCSFCRAGYLSGTAAVGGPLADADVLIVDAQGRQARGRTDAQGRYEVPVTQLAGSLLVQVTGQAGGEPVRLHGACRSAEIGNRAVNVTPLTELVVAQALGALPARLLRDGRVDFFRLDASSLSLAEQAVETLVRPLLDAAGVPAQIDLRVSPLAADGGAVDRALAWTQLLLAAGGAYTLRHAGMAQSEALLLQPGRIASAQPLPAPNAQWIAAAAASTGELKNWLAQWNNLFANDLPPEAAARAMLADDLLEGGLDADTLVQRVLRREDSAEMGGFSLRGARWHDARLVDVRGPDELKLRLQLSLPGALPAAADDWWFVRRDGRWLLRGDGAPARVAVRHLAVLGPQPLGLAAVRALPGVVCPAQFDLLPELGFEQRCHALHDASAGSSGGVLDLGVPADRHFGALALFHSLAETPEARLQEHARMSQALAVPSSRVQRMLSFEVDARRSDRRAAWALVTGPGLPAAGLKLVPPATHAGAPMAEHWTLDADSDDDWHAVPLGWCEAAADDAEASACASAWQTLGAGSRFRFELFDAQGQSLAAQDTALAEDALPESTLLAEAAARFARFELVNVPTQQPQLATLWHNGNASDGDGLTLQLPWKAASSGAARPTRLQLDWWRAPWPDAASGDRLRRQAWVQPAPGAAASWDINATPSPGQRTRWLAMRVDTQDVLGNRYLHFVAPNNPH
jgi:hypothetical protein